MSSNRDIWVNRCRKQIQSRFSLAQAAVLRWEQLLRGARPRIHTDNPKWMETPLREIADEAIQLDKEEFVVKLAGTPYEPPRPEASDDLDQLLGGVLEGQERLQPPAEPEAAAAETVAAEAVVAEAAPAEAAVAETAVAEAESSTEDGAGSAEAAAVTKEEDIAADAADNDKEKTEPQAGDAA
jgi:DNA-directed RNA polymerase subunit K/omega